jgi:hypothetical protein
VSLEPILRSDLQIRLPRHESSGRSPVCALGAVTQARQCCRSQKDQAQYVGAAAKSAECPSVIF